MPSPDLSERAARAALAAHFPPAQLAEELSEFPVQEVWRRRLSLDSSGRLARYSPAGSLQDASGRFLIPSDEAWPAALADLGPHGPLGVWVCGADQLPQLSASAVAVTGSRNAARQAVARAHSFAAAVAAAGHTVTATLAHGIDSAAHQAAARAGQASLAVLPCGLDRAHPEAQATLLRSIPASGGAVLSLYPPGTPASGLTLQASARLLAALSRALIVIKVLDDCEPAMLTATVAVRLRRLLLLPSPTDARADPTDWLLTTQQAVPVTDPQAALALL
ncbi:DNA-processing protein DprA [Streptomyces sp. cg36]|uniref:DNA-processing protein DprA n=1 Tax=Streptomyces sp. cg36 TaxID=3238798 RepID=UPI0034E1E6AC